MKEPMNSASSPTVSAVILTLNEEETIKHAITSLSWCDEIFVVDSESQDRTCEIAEALGAKIYKHQQEGAFLISEQRNWALQSLPFTGEWILFMDADEESTEEFREQVMRAASTATCDAFYAAPAFMYYGKWLKRTSGYPNWHPRIVKANSSVKFTGGVWEDFDEPEAAGRISAPYIHETNAKGLEDWLTKHVRYAKWESDRIRNRSASGTSKADRRGLLRAIRYRLGGLRKYAATAYLFIGRRGFLDGAEGRSYLRRMFIYELLIDEFGLEGLKRAKKGEGN
ncbi:glycosyltransferase family 2 protein [Pseudarthrobacter sp. NPDC058329]|uniref:glycosyltransferase family 2 protein n=1 Tax=Pseudarthrobacter sp. NPDC058329 TaxID=3346448 RepID=UPI0036DE834F